MCRLRASYVPGCYNFDPLGLYGLLGADASGRKGMRELETAHGRFAMVAISIWAFLEPSTKARAQQSARHTHAAAGACALPALPRQPKPGGGAAALPQRGRALRGLCG